MNIGEYSHTKKMILVSDDWKRMLILCSHQSFLCVLFSHNPREKKILGCWNLKCLAHGWNYVPKVFWNNLDFFFSHTKQALWTHTRKEKKILTVTKRRCCIFCRGNWLPGFWRPAHLNKDWALSLPIQTKGGDVWSTAVRTQPAP